MDITCRAGLPLEATGRKDPGATGGALSPHVLAAVLSLVVAGCYTDKCAKMGYAEGTPENARCAHQLQTELTQQLNTVAQQLNTLSQTLAQQRGQKGKNKDNGQGEPADEAAAGVYGDGTIGQVPTPAVSSMYDSWGAAGLRGYGY